MSPRVMTQQYSDPACPKCLQAISMRNFFKETILKERSSNPRFFL